MTIGNCKPRVMAQLLQFEKVLASNPDLRKAYTDFMNDVQLATLLSLK